MKSIDRFIPSRHSPESQISTDTSLKNVYGIRHKDVIVKAWRTFSLDDSYFTLNALDYSSGKLIATAYQDSLVVLNHNAQNLVQERPLRSSVSSVRFNEDCMLFAGDESGRLQLYEVGQNRCSAVRVIKSHCASVSCIQIYDKSIVISASSDFSLILHDIRKKKTEVIGLHGHSGGVCCVSVCNGVIASGGWDRRILLWDVRGKKPVGEKKYHSGVVKAVKWSKERVGVLGSGGGGRDGTVVVWNQNKDQIEVRADVKSVVSGLEWRGKNLMTAHSNGKQGYVIEWELQSKKIFHKFVKHQGEIKHLCMNPKDDDEFITTGADGKLKCWRVPQKK